MQETGLEHEGFVPLKVRQVADDEVFECFDLLQQVGHWLKSRGRVQRVAMLPMDVYRRWQSDGFNYCVTAHGRLAGIYSVPTESFVQWPSHASLGPAPWLRTLATHPDFRGQGVGRFAVESALDTVGSRVPLYLDCAGTFLPGYYRSLGFQPLSKQQLTSQSGQMTISLMVHPNAHR